ncbi:hypothetical protein [Streptomyces sp. TLI_185]|nr:hypothetical protein [Streptomyces sp. TLI_185]
MLDGEPDREAVPAGLVSSFPPQDEELLRKLLQETEETKWASRK